MKITNTEKTSGTLYILFIITAHIQNSYAKQPVQNKMKISEWCLAIWCFFSLVIPLNFC